jgi:hypothetical protein
MGIGRRRVFAIASALALLTLLSAAGGRAATDRGAQVVVVTSGLVPGGQDSGSGGYGYAEYALVLRNRSSSRDAIDVAVEVEAVDPGDRSFADDYVIVTVIPAGADFVISGSLMWRGSFELAGIETEVRVGQSEPRRRRLPPVKGVSVTSSGGVTGSFTNPYKKPLPWATTIYGVVLDSQGRILAAGYDLADAVTRPGATVAFDILGKPTAVPLEAGTSVKVSVDPCGYLAFTRVCPVPGAQR